MNVIMSRLCRGSATKRLSRAWMAAGIPLNTLTNDLVREVLESAPAPLGGRDGVEATVTPVSMREFVRDRSAGKIDCPDQGWFLQEESCLVQVHKIVIALLGVLFKAHTLRRRMNFGNCTFCANEPLFNPNITATDYYGSSTPAT